MRVWKKDNCLLLICADDFGISPLVGEGILELADEGVITHISCMTSYPEWEEEARKLKAIESKVEIGLHLTLNPYSLSKSFVMAKNQIALFKTQMGRLPAFIDSHRNYHILPYLHDPLKEALVLLPHTKLRSYEIPLGFQSTFYARTKNDIFKFLWRLGPLSRLNLKYFLNRSIISQESLARSMSFKEWMSAVERRLCCLLPGINLWVVHPGKTDQILRSRDKVTDFRQTELEFMRHSQFITFLDNHFSQVVVSDDSQFQRSLEC